MLVPLCAHTKFPMSYLLKSIHMQQEQNSYIAHEPTFFHHCPLY